MKILLALLLFISFSVKSQELVLPAELLTEFNQSLPERYWGTDAFGWKYTSARNEFRKAKGNVVVEYKAVALSTINSADIFNPLQLVLFYEKFNTAVLLDNQLNETTRINFSELQPPVVAEAVGLSAQNRLWVYDINTQQVGLYDPAPRQFKTLIPPFNETLKYYQSQYNSFYWVDNTNTLYSVNIFGKVNLIDKLPEFESLHIISSKQILLQINNSIYLYNTKTKQKQRIAIAEKSFKSFDYKTQILSIFTDNEIIQYKITLPE